MSRRELSGIFLALTALVCSSGCYSANLYTTARTVPQGQTDLVVAAEYFAATKEAPKTGEVTNQPRPLEQVTRGATAVIGVRRGLGSWADLGVTAHLSGMIHADVKAQPLEGLIDLAIVQGVDLGYFYRGLSSSLLVGARLGQYVQLVASTGVALHTAGEDFHYVVPGSTSLRLGGGIRFQLPSTHLALQPEITRLWGGESTRPGILTVGLGFSYME